MATGKSDVKEPELETQEQDQGAPSEETKNTEGHMIPKARFDEVNNEAKALRKRLDELDAEKKARDEKQLEEQGKYKELIDSLRSQLVEVSGKASKVEEYEATLGKLLQAELAALPEQSRRLVPEKLSIQDRLDYIAENRELLVKPAAPNIGAGSKGTSGEPTGQVPNGFYEAAQAFGLSKDMAQAAAKRLAEGNKQ